MAAQRAGWETVGFCEIDPFCQQVLNKNWPDVPIYEDIRNFHGTPADIITAGFPCQNISSVSVKRTGLAGKHSGLWGEARRIICNIRPQWVLLENSPSLCVRGLGEVLADLAAIGYDAEWHGLSAASVGALHYRARQWVLAYPPCVGNRAPQKTVFSGWFTSESRPEWPPEPDICRVADGVPNQVDRLRSLGNAIVPQIAEAIFMAINEVEFE